MASKYAKVFTICLILATVVEDSRISTVRFRDSHICSSFQHLVNNGHLLDSNQIFSSSIECSAKCAQNDTCFGTIRDGQTKCQLLKYSHDMMNITDPYCSKHDSNIIYIKKRECENGGDVSSEWPRVCICPKYWLGLFCHRLAGSCLELKENDFTGSGNVWVELQVENTITPVLCSFSPTIKIMLLKSKRIYDQNLSWQQYVDGYYIDEDHHFVGLELLHVLTNIEYSYTDIKIEFKNMSDEVGARDRHFFVHYYNLTIGDAKDGYALDYEDAFYKQLHADFLKQNVTDCLSVSRGVPFSTWDHDRDQDDTKNCAFLAKAGWWFNRCDPLTYCSLLGRMAVNLPTNSTSGKFAFPGFNMTGPDYDNWVVKVTWRLRRDK